MVKYIFLLTFLAITGCVSSESHDLESSLDRSNFESKEKILIDSGDNQKLISFYKQEIMDSDSVELKIKLIEAYLEIGDIESAIFYLEQTKATGEYRDDIYFLRARAYYQNNELDRAEKNATNAIKSKDKYAEAENLMGLIYAGQGKYDLAKQYFNQARQHHYNDVAIKNNLAVVDLLEEDYQKAVFRLESLFNNGLADRQVKVNLALAYAKLGQFEQVVSVLGGDYSAQEIQHIYMALRHAKTNHNAEAPAAEL